MKVMQSYFSSSSWISKNSLNVIWALYFDSKLLLLDDELFLETESYSSWLLILILLGLTYFLSMADWVVSILWVIYSGENLSISWLYLVYLIADVNTEPVTAVCFDLWTKLSSFYFLVVSSSISSLLIFSERTITSLSLSPLESSFLVKYLTFYNYLSWACLSSLIFFSYSSAILPLTLSIDEIL